MTMSKEPTSPNTMLLLLVAASLGAVAMALVTPKTGKELRGILKAVGNRLRGQPEPDDSLEEPHAIAMFI
jgi:hypothetical protein